MLFIIVISLFKKKKKRIIIIIIIIIIQKRSEEFFQRYAQLPNPLAASSSPTHTRTLSVVLEKNIFQWKNYR